MPDDGVPPDSQSAGTSLPASAKGKRHPLKTVLLVLLTVAFPPLVLLWLVLWILGKRPKFSLGTLLLAVLLIGSGATLWWRWESWRVQVTFDRLPREMVRDAAFSPDGQRVVTANDDGTARIADAHTGVELLVLKGHKGWVWVAAYSPDGKRILTAGTDATARIWDAETGAALVTLTGHSQAVRSACFSPDGSTILTSGDDRTVRLWDATSGTQTAVLDAELLAHRETPADDPEPVKAFSEGVFTSAGPRVLTFTEYPWKAQLRDAKTGAALLQLKGADDTGGFSYPVPLAFSPDETKLFFSDGNRVRIWDATTGAELRRIEHSKVRHAALSPAGDLLASCGDHILRLWDFRTGKELAAMQVPRWGVLSAAFSPDGRRIVTGHYTFASIWERVRPESDYGVLVLPELWLAVVFAGLLLRSLWRDWRDIARLTAKPQ